MRICFAQVNSTKSKFFKFNLNIIILSPNLLKTLDKDAYKHLFLDYAILVKKIWLKFKRKFIDKKK